MEVQKFDGFVSRRDDSEAFATALVSRLATARSVKAADEKSLDGPDHVEAASKLIISTYFTVIVIGPNKLKNDSNRTRSFQQAEIEVALAHYRQCLHEEKHYELFFVHLTDTPSVQETDNFNELIGRLPYGSRTFHHVYHAPTAVSNDQAGWDAALDKVSHAVRHYFDENGIEPVPERESGVALKGADRVSLTTEERSYIDHNLPNWLKGHTHQLDLVGGPTDEATRIRHSLFSFIPQRCIVLDARRLPGDDEQSDGKDRDREDGGNQFDRIPVLNTIFKDDQKPLMVTGPAGAGKTTSLTTAAALMAGRASSEFRARVEDLMTTSMGELVTNLPPRTKFYFPIVVRATSLAAELGTNKQSPWDDFGTLIDFLIRELHMGRTPASGIEVARAQMKKRLEEQPYAIFIDALDEVLTNSVALRILKMAKYAYSEFFQKDRHIKIVLSSRQTIAGKDDTHNLAMEPLRLDQIDSYLDSFVRSLASATQQAIEKFKREARISFDERDSLLEFLSQPFNLNWYCWLAWQDWKKNGTIETPRSETEFFRFIINHLIVGLNLQDPNGNDLPMGMLRLLLRRMAYDALNSDDGMNSLRVVEAEKLCAHTLSSAYAYMSDEEDFAQIEPEYVRQLLSTIAAGTDLLARQGDTYQFPKVRFCEYLAGERIDADALTTASLRNMRHSKLKQMLSSIRYCYGLRIKRNVADYANNVLERLLERAKDAVAEEKFEQGFDWLNGALECYGSGIDANFAVDGRSEPETTGYFMVRKHALEMIAEYGKQLEPARRAQTISLLLRLGRRANSSLTVAQIQSLFGELIEAGIASRWVRVSVATSDTPGAPTREIQVERTPVLVCEFEDFLMNHNEADNVWEHADNVDEIRIDSEKIQAGSKISPEEIWRNQRRNPGNPVTSVTWYEAVAYAKWLSRKERDNYVYRLPTEYEMHAISILLAGDMNHTWGNTLSRGKEAEANWRGAEIGTVCPPGTFPALEVPGPDGPVGKLVDFGSNVRVWTLDTADTGTPVWDFNSHVSNDKQMYVWGASWVDRKEFMNAKKRGERFDPSIKDPRIGIRLVREMQQDG